jgi:hypothetical protein
VRAPPKQKLPEAGDARTGANALRADEMTPAARLSEVAQILAAGLSRLKARQSSALPADFGESSLDCAAAQSGPANVLTDGGGN